MIGIFILGFSKMILTYYKLICNSGVLVVNYLPLRFRKLERRDLVAYERLLESRVIMK